MIDGWFGSFWQWLDRVSDMPCLFMYFAHSTLSMNLRYSVNVFKNNKMISFQFFYHQIGMPFNRSEIKIHTRKLSQHFQIP